MVGSVVDMIVRLILEFADAFGVGHDEACDWLCREHPEFAGSVERMRAARARAVARTED